MPPSTILQLPPSTASDGLWVFGYGSLIWNPNFPYVEMVPGVVRGYVRRFWTLSPDHRGTPEKPGRVVSLIPDANGGTCWGLAYRVPADAVESTISYLNLRESAGYQCEQVEFHPDDGRTSFALHVYISRDHAENIYHTGPTEIDTIVREIISSRGKSGSNLEYALRLADSQRRMAPHFRDDHLFEIERRLLELCAAYRINDNVLWRLGYDMEYLRDL
ncbi:ChaC-like protein [Aphelenchoides avenae]|nr:ChaC-like protein [Aphelenchus avenae]